MQGKQNQVLNFSSKVLKWLILVILFPDFIWGLFWALIGGITCMQCLFFPFSSGIFASQKFYTFTCCLGGSSLNCPKFTKICPFSFSLYACSDNYADISPIISQIYRYQPQGWFCFSSFISFQTSYESTIKPTNRTNKVLLPARSPHDITSSTKK